MLATAIISSQCHADRHVNDKHVNYHYYVNERCSQDQRIDYDVTTAIKTKTLITHSDATMVADIGFCRVCDTLAMYVDAL